MVHLAVLMMVLMCQGCYSLRQAYHFNALYNSRRPVSDVIADPSTNPKVRKKLQEVARILEFAKGHGLNAEGAYEEYIATESGAVSHLLQAARPDQLELKRWWFPFVGSVPYLGFFHEAERDRELARLSQEYDTSKGKVGAFSSLGWFEDPIFTSMLNRNQVELAHLFFHELVHRTFWSSGSVRFNENLAEFGATRMVEVYLQSLGQKKALASYYGRRRDQVLYKDWLKRLRDRLRELYAQPELSRDDKLQRKAQIIADFQTGGLPKFETKRYHYIARKAWNNASILGASLYTPNMERFESAYRCAGSPGLGRFLEILAEAEDQHEDCFKALDSLCAKR